MPDSVLTEQIVALEQQLGNLTHLLAGVEWPGAQLDAVRLDIERSIRTQAQALARVKNETGAGAPIPASWKRFYDVQQASSALFSEALALSSSALARRRGLDNGLCRIADALLRQLSARASISWNRFTTVADGEFLGTLGQIIRLRFPENNIWNLPIAAHEFGHFVGPQLGDRIRGQPPEYPFRRMLEDEVRDGPMAPMVLHERFADLFATYSLGPAFAWACLRLRFNPRLAYLPDDQHPPDAERAYAILRTLCTMNDEDPNKPLSLIVRDIETAWLAAMTAAGCALELWQRLPAKIDSIHDKLYNLLTRHTNQQLNLLRNGDWQTAQLQYAKWRNQWQDNQPLQSSAGDGSLTLTAILNAAWLFRAYSPDMAEQVGRAAQAMLEEAS
ncbi:MAG: hypothetical protein WCD37_08665 [Chloroflexia bacterium]